MRFCHSVVLLSVRWRRVVAVATAARRLWAKGAKWMRYGSWNKLAGVRRPMALLSSRDSALEPGNLRHLSAGLVMAGDDLRTSSGFAPEGHPRARGGACAAPR